MDALAIDALELERLALQAWVPDDVEDHDGWLLRAADGFTGRGNSALVLRDPGDGLDDHLRHVRGWYRDRGLPALVAVPLPACRPVHDALLAREWTLHHGGRVLVRDMPDDGGDAPTTPPGVAIAIEDVPSRGWLSQYHYRGEALPDAGRRMLARGELIALVSARVDGRVVAIARGTVAGGWLGVNAVETDPDHRRQGHATRLLAALVDWARDRDAAATFLQVDLANDVARTVYERAGFREHHTYVYLEEPAAQRRA